ncbi:MULTISPECIES: DUF1273 domain-containing protein [Paenibacillus]|uniref:DUF1273 domain-containing protein n=1 Tax=Paenibacillus TaxID=44249 RepID=UPI0022B8E291|nr:DUF1273 domain-containing protein [Paenibacillus caseinilyticus]MCZ8521208.1 DUF1273 domain-containing protein [Paenibacillus caseinilyticus]
MLKRVLVTGYKASELGIFSLKHPGIPIIKKAIRKQLLSLLDDGLEWVIVSGQWGVEFWAAETALELKGEGWALQLAVITPFLEPEENWSEDKQNSYRSVTGRADYVNSVTKTKYDGPWQFKEKDRFLLRNTDGLLLVYDEEQEGSPRFIREMALKHAERVPGYRIVTVNALDLQSIAEEEQLRYDG